jgi:hypothetical protein
VRFTGREQDTRTMVASATHQLPAAAARQALLDPPPFAMLHSLDDRSSRPRYLGAMTSPGGHTARGVARTRATRTR